MIATPQAVLKFWRAAGPRKWFAKSRSFDRQIRARFRPTYQAAASGALARWERAPKSTLALLITLDQFPRNMFRASARAFAADPLARRIARRAVARGYDKRVPKNLRQFIYLPFEHSEAMTDQMRCMALFRATGDRESLKWAKLHADIIEKYGRFPHRNAALGRVSTLAEKKFLASGGFGG